MNKPYIEIVTPERLKYTLWNRLKTALWNFILPPHIHLSLQKNDESEGA